MLKKIYLRLLRRLANTKNYQVMLWVVLVSVGITLGVCSWGFALWPAFIISTLLAETIALGGLVLVMKAGDRYVNLPVKDQVFLLEEHRE